jgi:selenide,water dikinase
MTEIRMSQYSHGAGCACKLSSAELTQILGPLRGHPSTQHTDLLVGFGSSDDAGVFRLQDGSALVQTVDFFAPVVDDPFDWGQIAATNALSDVYAMGGRPLTALQILGWPRDRIPFEIATSVQEGGAEVMAKAGATIVGGHSIDSPEPIYGFAITGVVAGGAFVTNAGAQVGDVLVLTKPLGLGIITTAIKRDLCPPEVAIQAVSVMVELNAGASEAMVDAGAHAATDVTGFGLLGHLREMLAASGVSARLDLAAIPVLAGTRDLLEAGCFPGGSQRNLQASNSYTDGAGELSDRQILSDAQTSGGLLISLPIEDSGGIPGGRVIGEVVDGPARIQLS